MRVCFVKDTLIERYGIDFFKDRFLYNPLDEDTEVYDGIILTLDDMRNFYLSDDEIDGSYEQVGYIDDLGNFCE